MFRCLLILLLCALSLSAAVRAGEVRKCVDAQGAVSYQQDACAKGHEQAGLWNYDESAEWPTEPPASVAATARTPSVGAMPPVLANSTDAAPAAASRSDLRPSNLLECIAVDGSYYLRAERCRTRTEATPFTAIDPATGQTIAVLGPPREIVDPGRPLIRGEACSLARQHLQRMRADMSRTIDRLREVEQQIAENCDP